MVKPKILQFCAAWVPFTCLCLAVPLPGAPCSSIYEEYRSAPLSGVPNPTYLLPHPWSLSSSASEPHQVWEETQAYGPRQAGPGGLDRPEGCYLDPQDKEATCHTSPCGPVTRMNI